MKPIAVPVLAVALALALATLSAQENAKPAAAAAAAAAAPATPEEVVKSFADIAYYAYSDSLAQAQKMRSAFRRFLSKPTEDTHNSAKMAWLRARLPYAQTSVFEFYQPTAPKGSLVALLDAWPVTPGVIDYTKARPNAGIINDAATYPEITTDLLLSLHQGHGPGDVTIGWHAIEFILWGEDHKEFRSGDRSYTDFVASEANKTAARRRGHYLLACAELIIEHLREAGDRWRPKKADNLRGQLLALPPAEALKKIMAQIDAFMTAELVTRRLSKPYASPGMELEVSSFSDATHHDHVHNMAGVTNILMGHYVGINGQLLVEGTGFAQLLERVDPKMAAGLKESLNASFMALATTEAPFDQSLLRYNKKEDTEKRAAVKAAIEALEAEAALIRKAAAKLGLN